jgi:hypothetical protein
MAAPDLTPEQNSLLEEMRRKFEAADAVHKPLRASWDRLDRLYHSRRDLLESHRGASNDQDRRALVEDARRTFGTDLLIPYALSVVETVLPRMLSNRPRMLVTPRNGAPPGSVASPGNVEAMRVTIDSQQHASNYELKLQSTARSGLIYGLGVQQIEWRTQTETRKRLARRIHGDNDGRGEWAEQEYECVLWDDPDANHVSIYDFLWDPYGSCMDTVGYVIHRSWRSTSYVLGKLTSHNGAPPAWSDEQGQPMVPLTAEDLAGDAAKSEYTSLWSSRWSAQGKSMDLKEPVHEVWQVHLGGKRIVTVLDRKWPVAVAPNPAWHGRMPFAIFRPTEVLDQFCGKGEIEPMEDLSREMNALRSDRRYQALMKLFPPMFYDDGAFDPGDVKVGPGIMNPVNSGGIPLHQLIHQVNVGDIPNSGYQEEVALQQDIERVTGISDPVSGGSGAEQTATGVQLIQAAAGMRIQMKTRRLEVELIRRAAKLWLALNQQRIVSERTLVLPATPTPDQPERRWAQMTVGPRELAGEMDIEPDGGSTAPENVPQKRQDGQMLMALMGAPGVDPRKLMPLILENFGIKTPDSVMLPEVHVPPSTLDYIAEALTENGMDQTAVQQVVQYALDRALDEEEQGGGGQMPAAPDQPPEQVAA